MRFDDQFTDEIFATDGRVIALRFIRPSDKSALELGLKQCSERSIYHRFLGAKPKFTQAELRYLTEVDSTNHVAIVGFCDGQLMAVARAILLPGGEAADLALIVADCFQGQGIGGLLLGLLIRAVLERGVFVVCGEMFATNGPMFHLIDELPFATEWNLDGSVVSFRTVLIDESPD